MMGATVASFDVLGLGCSAIDDLLYVANYPEADEKVEVVRRERHAGGLTATALVAAARLGARCAYVGTIGRDELSQFMERAFVAEGIAMDYAQRRDDVRPVHSIIVVDETRHTRNIFFYRKDATGAAADWPPEEVVCAARALLVDHFGVEGMIRAARIARAKSIPVIADFEGADSPRFPELLDLVDHLILSRNFAAQVTGDKDPATAVGSLWTAGRQLAAVTCGREGCWYISAERPGVLCHQPALTVEAVDTTGCGDVFHGAYAAALVGGRNVHAALRFAAVASGLKATQRGGQAGIPTREVVEAHLAKTCSECV